jgi:putative transcription factor
MRDPPLKVALTSSPPPRRPKVEAELEVDPDYNVIVRQAREKLGLSQEALGMMISVKPSLISHVETKKLKPDIALARKLMHQLKVNLLVTAEELDSSKRE